MKFIGYEIIKETEKAVAIENQIYRRAKETEAYDVKELSNEEHFALKNDIKYVWLPKSQVDVDNGRVVDMPKWLAVKNQIITKSIFDAVLSNSKNSEEDKEQFAKDQMQKGIAI